jgi:hypothetical protein
MKELIAFLLPPATALAGMRIVRWTLGPGSETQFGFGLRFACGLAVGMLVFSQVILSCALAGVNAAMFLAWAAILWGCVEMCLLAAKLPASWRTLVFQPARHLLLLLLPLLYCWWVLGWLSTLEGTIEFDANAFWVFKAKILFLDQGTSLIHVLRTANLSYAHMDYPMLVPCLYTLDYGAVGRVDEFVNKVWPFWMMVAFSIGILSLARTWTNPRFLPIAVVTFLAYLPATLKFTRNEGGTIPMVFFTGLAALLIVSAIYSENEKAPAMLVLVLAGCFSTKFEGIIFAALCCCALLPFALRRGWLTRGALWKSAGVAAISIVPYLCYRLARPVPNWESSWFHTGMADSASTLHRFPQVWFLDVFARFFSPDFFQWRADNDHLQWVGHWTGLGSFVNDQLAVLPWLLLVLIFISIASKPSGRPVVGVFSAVVLLLFTFLSFVVSCLKKDDLQSAIDFTCGIVGRYYYPFFSAWFLATTAIWFADPKPAAQLKSGT